MTCCRLETRGRKHDGDDIELLAAFIERNSDAPVAELPDKVYEYALFL